MGHKIRSKKAPFANLANIIYERELVKLLLLYYPSLGSQAVVKPPYDKKFMQKIRVLQGERMPHQELYTYLENISLWLKIEFTSDLEVVRYGKFCFSEGNVLRTRLSENPGKSSARSYRYFEAVGNQGNLVFGEGLAFFEIVEHSQKLVVYQPLAQVTKSLSVLHGKWSGDIAVLPVSSLHSLVGIFCVGKTVYILRKHPGLEFLDEADKGKEVDQTDINELNDENE